MAIGSFSLLTPQAVLDSIEASFGVSLDGTVQPYTSYVNRVYGLRTDEGDPLVAKFYRPGRWSFEAIQEEHAFVVECAQEEIPVIAPLRDVDGETLCEVDVVMEEAIETYAYALYPRMGGRNFDPEADDDWFRLGGVVGRIHQVGRRDEAPNRAVCRPETLTLRFVDELLSAGLVHDDISREFHDICTSTLNVIAPLFASTAFQRVHGDCHRGNVLDRPDEGLLVIDFDDMMTAPAVQDLWLLLPERAAEARRELTMLIEGYTQFSEIDHSSLRLIEPLRFMRMIYFLAWQARQKDDYQFRNNNPDWGSRGFWIKQVEDLREQAQYIADDDAAY